jgi:hypothetical protein
MEQKKLGGKRKGAGRKPVLSKKKQVSLYVEGSKILKFGSEEKMKELIYQFVDNYNPVNVVNLTTNAKLPDEYVSSPIEFSVMSGKPYDETVSSVFATGNVFATSPFTGLPPKVSLFDDFMSELKQATMVSQVENIMKRAKGEVFTPKQKIELEGFAKQVSKEMFND